MVTTPLPVDGEFQVNTTEANTQREPAVTELTDGRFVVVWMDGSQSADDPSGTAVRGQVFDADGTPSGGEFLVNTTTDNNQDAPEVTALAGGGFAVAWADLSVSDLAQDKFRVVTQVFDSNAHKVGGEIFVSAGDHPIGGFAPPPVSIDTLADGNLVVSWFGASNVRSAVFEPDGDPVKADFVVVNALDDAGGSDSSNVANVTALANGDFVVAWSDYADTNGDLSANDKTVRAMLFNADGTPATGSELIVNVDDPVDYVPLHPDDEADEPNVVALSGGGFVVVWRDATPPDQVGSDKDGTAIKARIFSAAGVPGNEFFVDTTIADDQTVPVVAALPDGGFVVVWQANGGSGDGSGAAIRGQRFTAAGAKSGGEFLVNELTDGGQTEPAIHVLDNDHFVVSWSTSSGTASDSAGGAVKARIFTIGASGPTGGDDVLNGTSGKDSIDGLGGDDTIHGKGGGDILKGSGGKDHVFGNGGNDKLYGGNGNDTLVGGSGKDRIHGNKGNDTLKGQGSSDKLFGDGGKDVLDGGKGSDLLDGGGGRDKYVFKDKLGHGVDHIVKFQSGEQVRLDSAVFKHIGSHGTLAAKYFHAGAHAHDGNDHILYQHSTGKVFYDSNGDASGGRTLFAVIDNTPHLHHDDFFVI